MTIKKATMDTTYKISIPVQWSSEQTIKDLIELKNLLNRRWSKMDLTENRLLISKIIKDLGIEED